MNANMGKKPIIITSPDISAFWKYVANMMVFAVVADCIPRNIPIAASVTPTAGRFFMNLPNDFKMFMLAGVSFVFTEFSFTRTVSVLIIKMKAIKPRIPIISAAQNTLLPSKI